MFQNYNKLRVLGLFFERPTTELYLRQISRLTDISPASTKRYLKELQKEELISISRKGLYPTYRAARDMGGFKNLKKWLLPITLSTFGLIDHVVDRCSPDVIILFGSASRGADIDTSDIDIAIVSKESELDLGTFEKRLNRKISPLFIGTINEVSAELKNNLINGIVLYGYLKVF